MMEASGAIVRATVQTIKTRAREEIGQPTGLFSSISDADMQLWRDVDLQNGFEITDYEIPTPPLANVKSTHPTA